MDWYLALYLVAAAVFGVAELVAVFNGKRGDTLSEKVWQVVFRDGKPRWLPWSLLAGGLVWLTAHLLTGGAI